VQGLNEEVQGGRPQYRMLTFRGSFSALDAITGAVIWKTYTVGERRSRGTNAARTPQWGPAGGGIWSAPTVDVRRGAIYVGTGNGYAHPAQPMTDAVLALDLKSGSVRWANQVTPNDTWTLGCGAKNPDNLNCPDTLGPDYDFSASPALVTAGGRDLLVLPQKSGMTFALDPDKQGALVWQLRIGQGSGRGGQLGRRDRRPPGIFRAQRRREGGRRDCRRRPRRRQTGVEPPGGAAAVRDAQPRLQRLAGRSRNRHSRRRPLGFPGRRHPRPRIRRRHGAVAIRHQPRVRDRERRQSKRR
jgi:hypothetical protein